MRPAATAVDVRGLSKSYVVGGKKRHVVVEGFDLEIREGEFVSLIGHSGCGKSTVLSIVAGLTERDGGIVTAFGREITRPGLDRGVVFQSPCLFDWMTAHENVALGVDSAFGSLTPLARRGIVDEHLALVGLAGHMHRKASELSLGMRQRVGLARAFALSPKMLLLDEPFGMLDSITRMELQEVLVDLWTKDRKTALMVTHDVDEAILLSDRIVMMTNGPSATIGGVLEVPFERPRERIALLGDARYQELRDQLIGFLEKQNSPHEVVRLAS